MRNETLFVFVFMLFLLVLIGCCGCRRATNNVRLPSYKIEVLQGGEVIESYTVASKREPWIEYHQHCIYLVVNYHWIQYPTNVFIRVKHVPVATNSVTPN